jgi:hypothetical protein
MPANYVLLEKLVVGAAGSTGVAFQNIPQTGYTDLLIKVSGRSSTTGNQRNAIDLSLTFNGNSTGYSSKILTANPGVDNPPISVSNAGSSIVWAGEVANGDSTSNTFGNFDIYIPNYASSNHKSISVDSVTENNSSNSELRLATGLWANTAAITQVTLSGGGLLQHTSFHLYGIAKLDTTPTIAPKATGGDTIMTDGTYWYHAFLSSGTFTPATALSCDVLTIAGGGGGRADVGGGGGAGGLLYSTSQSLTTTGYTVTIGAGGALSAGQGNSGSNSSFAALTATGGGGGNSVTGGAGGSGGGGGATGGTGTAGQGNNGGTGAGSGFYGQGGGGGASAVGANGTTTAGGAGGAGSNTYSTWLSATGTGVSGYLAGGGGGSGDFRATNTGSGAGGSGGGGAGSPNGSTAGVAGTANTGGGGGGGGYGAPAQNGGAGGSGLVIVRYAV